MKKIIFVIVTIIVAFLVYVNVNADEIIIPSSAIRVRVIANSNSIDDQKIKMEVKEYVDSYLISKLIDVNDVDVAKNIIDSELDNLKFGIKSCYRMSGDVLDQICERDFYFGIAGSGIMISTSDGMYKAPYFRPYGNPKERASIPLEYVDYFSKGCLDRSLCLWNEIDKLRKIKSKISELPEKIIYTNSNDEIVKTLKKEFKRI